MNPEEFVKMVEDGFRSGLTSGNPDYVTDLFTQDARSYFVGHSPPDYGRDAIREHVKRYFDEVTNANLGFKLLVSQGNTIVAESNETGIRKNGKPFNIRGCAVWLVQNDKIKEFRFYEIDVLFSASSDILNAKGRPLVPLEESGAPRGDADFWENTK